MRTRMLLTTDEPRAAAAGKWPALRRRRRAQRPR
jgi:hypothetical protein